MKLQAQKLLGIEVKNFCRIQEVSIQFDGGSFVIGGEHSQGKTSLFNAIEALVTGAAGTPKEPIHKGKKKATITGTFTDLVIDLTITAKTRRLVVKGRDGVVIPGGAQGILDKLYSLLTFRPLALMSMPAVKRVETLRKLVGLDFTESDAEREELYDKRTDVNKDLRRAKAAVESAPHHDGPPEAEVSVAELVKEVERRRVVNTSNGEQRSLFDVVYQEAKTLKVKVGEDKLAADRLNIQASEAIILAKATADTKVKRLQKEIDQVEAHFAEDDIKIQTQLGKDKAEAAEQLAEDEAKLAKMITAGKANRLTIDALVDEDIDEVTAQIETAEDTNRKVRESIRYAELIDDAFEYQEASAKLTTAIEKLDDAKSRAIAEADYPVPGLSVDDDDIRFNDLPFEQAGEAEQIHVCVAIGSALRPGIDLMLVRGASLLNEKKRALLMAEAEAAEPPMQLLFEVVGEEGATVVLEDGLVKE